MRAILSPMMAIPGLGNETFMCVRRRIRVRAYLHLSRSFGRFIVIQALITFFDVVQNSFLGLVDVLNTSQKVLRKQIVAGSAGEGLSLSTLNLILIMVSVPTVSRMGS